MAVVNGVGRAGLGAVDLGLWRQGIRLVGRRIKGGVGWSEASLAGGTARWPGLARSGLGAWVLFCGASGWLGGGGAPAYIQRDAAVWDQGSRFRVYCCLVILGTFMRVDH